MTYVKHKDTTRNANKWPLQDVTASELDHRLSKGMLAVHFCFCSKNRQIGATSTLKQVQLVQ